MTMFNREEAIEWVAEHVDAYIDGDLAPAKAAQLEALVDEYPECADELGLARKVKTALQDLPRLDPPDSVSTGVTERVRGVHRRRWIWSGLAAAAIALVVAGITLRPNETAPAGATDTASAPAKVTPTGAGSSISTEELDAAEEQLRWTLAYMGAVAGHTANALDDKALGEPLAKPMQRVANLMFQRTDTAGTKPATGDEG